MKYEPRVAKLDPDVHSIKIWMILINILSQLCALIASHEFTISNILFSVTWKDFTLLFVLYGEEDRAFAFSIGVYTEAKKISKRFALTLK